MSKVSFCRMTEAQYSTLAVPDPETIYFLTDTKKIMLGGNAYVHQQKADRFMISRLYADDTYGTAAWLDDDNSMNLCGYFAEPVSQFDLWVVSASPGITGNAVLRAAGQDFVVPVTGSVRKVTLAPDDAVTGRIEIFRNSGSSSDTLKDNGETVTVLVVDWRCC